VEIVLKYTLPALHKATLCTFSCIYAYALQPMLPENTTVTEVLTIQAGMETDCEDVVISIINF